MLYIVGYTHTGKYIEDLVTCTPNPQDLIDAYKSIGNFRFKLNP